MKVTLVTPHTHEGVQYSKGSEVEMSADQAAWYNKAVIAARQAEHDHPINKTLDAALAEAQKADSAGSAPAGPVPKGSQAGEKA